MTRIPRHLLIVAAALGCTGKHPDRAPARPDTLTGAKDSLPAQKTYAWQLSPPMQQALRDYAPGVVPYSVEQYSPQMMQSFRPPDVDPKDPLNQARGDFHG